MELESGAERLVLRNLPSLRHLGNAALLTLLSATPLVAKAQDSALPDAPSAYSQAAPQRPGTISGTITDADGDAIAGASITLSGDALPSPRTIFADREGYFSFLRVPAGNLKLTIISDGFATVSQVIALQSAEDLETPDIMLPVATADTDVEVSLTRHDAAEMDMQAEETQRLGGLIPNFYVSYNWHAPPLSAAQKFRMSFRSIIDPANFVIAGIMAGVEQSTNAYSGYGQGAQGFGKRYGASLADGAVGSLLGGAVFPALLHQDPRYFYKGTGSKPSRFFYAIGAAFVCRGDNGKWQPNYSSVLADVATGTISNTYYPASDQSSATNIVEVGLLNAVGESVNNLLEEFVFKHITTSAAKPKAKKP